MVCLSRPVFFFSLLIIRGFYLLFVLTFFFASIPVLAFVAKKENVYMRAVLQVGRVPIVQWKQRFLLHVSFLFLFFRHALLYFLFVHALI